MSVIYSGDGITFGDGSTISSGWTGFKNRVINGAMAIDQRNAGASKSISANTNAGTYTLDRWRFDSYGAAAFTVQQVSDAPSGFVKSLKVTVTTTSTPGADDRYLLMHQTEIGNTQDLSGQPISISFWVKGSVTGTYSVFLTNAIGDPYRREYIATYTINSANTWEYKTITVPAYAWDTGQQTYPNSYGLGIAWSLSMGSNRQYAANTWYVGGGEHESTSTQTQLTTTNSATWQITGVQVEKGSTASSFEYRPYGIELTLCQRYFYKPTQSASLPYISTGFNTGTTEAVGLYKLPVAMRITPSMTFSGTYQDVTTLKTGTTLSYASDGVTETSVLLIYQSFTGLTSQGPNFIRGTTANSYPSFSAEL